MTLGKMSSAEEFGDVAVNRGEAVVGFAFEQHCAECRLEHFAAVVVALVRSGIIFGRLAVQRESGHTRNQLNGTETSGGIDELVEVRVDCWIPVPLDVPR